MFDQAARVETIIDSETTLAYLAEEAYDPFEIAGCFNVFKTTGLSLQEIWEQVTAFSPATFVAGEKSLNDKN
ncbi:hypothetical protein Tco_1478785 [Tanacetum coccineum]